MAASEIVEHSMVNDNISEEDIKILLFELSEKYNQNIYKQQADMLHTLGCAYIQGYLYSKPLPYEEYVEYTKMVENEIISKGFDHENKIQNYF